jgi:N-acyl-D-aspartate/D-glutamate deacylase
MHNCQEFRGVPTWHPIALLPDPEKLAAYRDPEVRRKLTREVIEWDGFSPTTTIARNWYDKISVEKTKLAKNHACDGKSIRQLADAQGKGIIDAFLDLVVEENLDTEFVTQANNSEREIGAKILNFPSTCIGLSDGGAHVQFQSGVGYSTRLLGFWVREQGVMSLAQAVRRLTFEPCMVFGLYDRGLLRPGLAADITIFDPETVSDLPEQKVYDFPAGGWRMQQLAQGIACTIVNGQVLIEDGKPSGALPGKVLRNSSFMESVDT